MKGEAVKYLVAIKLEIQTEIIQFATREERDRFIDEVLRQDFDYEWATSEVPEDDE